MVTIDYFVRLSVDAAQTRLALMHPNERQQFLDAYLSTRQIDLNNPPPPSDPRCASQLDGHVPEHKTHTSAIHTPLPKKHPNSNPASAPASPAGWILVIFGAILLLSAYTYDVSAGGHGLGRDVANLDKMSFRMMLLSTGLASIITGNLCFGFAKILHALNLLRTAQENTSG